MLEKIKMLLDVGRLLGAEKMCECMKPEEARNIWLLLDEMNVDTNVTSQFFCGYEKANKANELKREMIFYGWENINKLKEYCKQFVYR